MIEQNKFQPISTQPIYGDNIGHVTLYDASHSNESKEQRIWTVTTIASLAYGNEEAKNPEALYERMKSVKHESLWEFIRWGESDGSYNSLLYSMRNFRGEFQTYNKALSDGFIDSIAEINEEHKQNIACFRIKVPIFVARQFMRHRSFSYLEMSRRYTKDAKVPFEFWFPKTFTAYQRRNSDKLFNQILTEMLEYGYHTQVASRFLPQTTYTEFYIMGEVEGLTNFFRLRLDEHAQVEIREVAKAMLNLLEAYQPKLYAKIIPH